MGHRLRKVLLDTHVLLWWLQGGSKLSPKVLGIVRDRESKLLVSAASAWEIAIKHKAGKLEAADLVARFEACLDTEGFEGLPISIAHAVRAGLLKEVHKDPFDRMLIAQAQVENVPIISNDRVFDGFSIRRLW
jgi:PIN domain nuclease of toxin-antitoxin system